MICDPMRSNEILLKPVLYDAMVTSAFVHIPGKIYNLYEKQNPALTGFRYNDGKIQTNDNAKL